MAAPGDGRPTRVVLVDDHPMLRAGTQAALQAHADLAVVGVANDGAEALRLSETLQPDVLVLDIGLPDMSGVEVARKVRATCPDIAILILSAHASPAYVRSLRNIGVRGFVSKTVSGDQLAEAVRRVAGGSMVIDLAGGSAENQAAEDLSAEAAEERLTARELEVLERLAAGRRNMEIAAELNVSLNTVEFHVRHVLAKLGTRSRTEAAVRAAELGLFSATHQQPSAS